MVEAEGPKTHYAICILNPDGGSGVSCVCKMTQVEGQPVQIQAEATGLTPGTHGFHVHVWGKYNSRFPAKTNEFYIFYRQSQQRMCHCWTSLEPRELHPR